MRHLRHLSHIIALPGFHVKNVISNEPLTYLLEPVGEVRCPFCKSQSLRKKDRFQRRVRHASIGKRNCYLNIKVLKFQCQACRKYFNQELPGILKRQRVTEAFKREVFENYQDGLSQRTLSLKLLLSPSTIERWNNYFYKRLVSERKSNVLPRVLGIDEHFFSRKKGFATTLCDLQRNKVFDVVLGRTEKTLEAYFRPLPGKERVKVVVMDLSDSYRAIIKKIFPKAKIVADRFHTIRLVNFYFLDAWKQLYPQERKNRGLLKLMRRHFWNLEKEQQLRLQQYLRSRPTLEAIYDFKQKLVKTLLTKHQTFHQCRRLIPTFLNQIKQLLNAPMENLKTLGKSLSHWQEEIVCMWRFTKTNSITEGLHNKMEVISRRAYGFRKFENYRIRILCLCG